MNWSEITRSYLEERKGRRAVADAGRAGDFGVRVDALLELPV